MDANVERVLDQLSATFSARDIMVKTTDLKRANDLPGAKQLLSLHPEFDIIPLPASGPLSAFFRRGEPKVGEIRSEDLISDGTSLLDLPDLFVKRDFFYVLSSNMISGFVHVADLNNGLVKLPFFVLFEAVERSLWPAATERLVESDLEVVLDRRRAEQLQQRMKRARKKNVDLGWAGLLSFGEILRFSAHYGIVQLSQEEQQLLAKIRNRVAHSDRLLVREHKDARSLVQSRQLCRELLTRESDQLTL